MKDHLVGDVPIAKGDYIGMVSVASHYNPKYFKNPEEFRPERWEKECNDLSAYAFNGFSGGPRSCLGQGLAMLESKVMLVIFLRRYKKFKLPVKKLQWTASLMYEPV